MQDLQLVTWEDWRCALDLFKAQIQSFSAKRKHFLTPSFVYYGKVDAHFQHLASREYFDLKIASGLHYVLHNEFDVVSYLKPKPPFGLRDYKFMTYPMRVLYYAVGMYFIRLTRSYLDNFYKAKFPKIIASYGANLVIRDNRLLTGEESYLYFRHFDKYSKAVRSEAFLKSRRIVIKLDVENCYDNISVDRLLVLLGNALKPSDQQRHGFNQEKINQIERFFKHAGRGRPGILQSDNDPISGFLGHLYLSFGDLAISDILEASSAIESFKIFRYVDDTYVILDFKEDDRVEIYAEARNLAHRIADGLFFRLGLKLNRKTEMFDLSKDDGVVKFKASVKSTSAWSINRPLNNRKYTSTELAALEHTLLQEVNRLVVNSRTDLHDGLHLESQIWKDVTGNAFRTYINKADSLERLESSLRSLNFHFAATCSIDLVRLISLAPAASSSFLDYLSEKSHLTTVEINACLYFLAEAPHEYDRVVKILQIDRHMKKLVEIFSKSSNPMDVVEYFNVGSIALERLAHWPDVIEQISLRSINKQLHLWAVSLNHLTNELQRISYYASRADCSESDYTADDVINYLRKLKLPSSLISQIKNLFDRRNVNSISHAADVGSFGRAVSEDEYLRYENVVGKCLRKVLAS